MDQKVIEVERKYRLSDDQFADLLAGLESTYYFGDRSEVRQHDIYLPPRSDSESLRLRAETRNGAVRYYLIVQSDVKSTGGGEKSQISTEIDSLVFESLHDLGRRLSADELPEINKQRHLFHGEREGWLMRVCLDKLEDLGDYSGHYLELETLCSDTQEVEGAVAVLTGLAVEIVGNDGKPLDMNYLDMYRKVNSPATEQKIP